MINAEAVLQSLDKNRALMETLKGHKLIGFALIIPPDGIPIEFASLGSHDDAKSFYQFLFDQLQAGLKQNQYGAIGTGR